MDFKILSSNEAAGYDDGNKPESEPIVPEVPEASEQKVIDGYEAPSTSAGIFVGSGYQDDSTFGAISSAQTGPVFSGRKIGRFEIIDTIGRGGMGEVLKGRDPYNSRIVAIKILDEAALKDRETLIRFEREAAAAAELDHPNIAKMYGLHYDDEGRPFIVMEYVDGTPLDRLLREKLDMQFSQMLDWIAQAAKGLEFARRRGIIHRDVKPANLIVDKDGAIRIIDFGLAKSMWDTSGVTATGMVVGTPRYMSPEQGMGRNVDHRSDIYALGATLYELITKQTPYDGDTPMSIMMKHINAPLTPPYVLHPKCPSDMNEIVVKMLAKDPNQRYQDYEPLIHDLESARIHRLAKERATETPSSDDLHGSPTMVELEPAQVGFDPHSSSRKNNPYLSEGLVKLDMSNIPDAEDNPRSPVMMIMVGVVILGFAVFAVFLQDRSAESRGEPGWLSRALGNMFGAQRSETIDAEALVQQDIERIDQTSNRIDALRFHVNRFRRANTGEIPQPRDLVRAGIVRDEEMLKDGWGNPFTIRREGAEVMILSPGRDGQLGNADDFKFSADSNRRIIPRSLRLEDLASRPSGTTP
jgi:serine/threonine protein kinase